MLTVDLKNFIGKPQLAVLEEGCRGEERKYFGELIVKLINAIDATPKTYEQDGAGDKAIAYLHYFKGSMDWYILERDMGDEQVQAFGYADFGDHNAELGYINIKELISNGVELDFHFDPIQLSHLKRVA